jgi:hypothetical protein
MRSPYIVIGLVLVAPGCSKPYRLAPVSGKVTLNGKPLANAWVHFAPVASAGKSDPGPTAHGQTNAEGTYTLHVRPEQPGAVVGKHRVVISLVVGGSTDQADAGGKAREKIPRRYNQETTLTYDVLPEGTKEANFDLKAP